MKLNVENMSDSILTAKFIKAVDLFFGMNPSNPDWILVALYFSKSKCLEIKNNYSGDDFILVTLDSNLITNEDILQSLKKEKISSRSIIAHVPDDLDSELFAIYADGGEDESCKFINKSSLNIFDSKQMEPTYLFEICETMMSLSDEWFTDFSSKAVELIMSKISSMDLKHDQFSQPIELSDLVIDILDARGGKLYNPYAGICSYAYNLSPLIAFFGQELNYQAYEYSMLNMLIRGKHHYSCVIGDSVRDWLGKDDFNYIVSTPPFNIRCDGNCKTSDEDFFVRSSIDAKKKAIGVYRTSICYFNSTLQTRKYIIDNDYLETVILLPSGIFPNTSISTTIIIVNKQKREKDMVRFIDATSCFVNHGRTKVLAKNAILGLCNCKENSNIIIDVPNSKISENNYNLFPNYYLKEEHVLCDNNSSVYYLNELISSYKSSAVTNTVGKQFKFSNSGKSFPIIIDSKELSNCNESNVQYKYVTEDCLVVSMIGRIRYAYLKITGEAVLIPKNYEVYHVNTAIINPGYLISEMNKDYFINQLHRFATFDSIVSSISKKDFLDLKVAVLNNKEDQLQAFLSTEDTRLKEYSLELDSLYKQRFDDLVLNQRQRKHAICQVLNELLPSVDNIQDFILSHDNVSKTSIVSPRSGKTLERYIEVVKEGLEKVDKMVENFTRQEKFGVPKRFELSKFLKNYCAKKIDDHYKAIYIDNGLNPIVNISQSDLSQMLDNLFTNAIKYGFNNSQRNDYQINVEIRFDESSNNSIAIKISNNGKPVSSSISLEKLFVWGEGHGSGIGCCQVREIAEHYNGTANYNEYTDDPLGFASEFNIVLPITED